MVRDCSRKREEKHNLYDVGKIVQHKNKLQESEFGNKTNGPKIREPLYFRMPAGQKVLPRLSICMLVLFFSVFAATIPVTILAFGCAPQPHLFVFMHLVCMLVASLCASPHISARVVEKRHCVSSSVPSLSRSLITV